MTTSHPGAAPLAGLRVLSLAEQYPGPFATMILADLGADVILIERPNGGDPTRRFSGHFEALNRNKRSIAADLKRPEGREIFWRLAESSDVVIEGFKPGVVARLGIGPSMARTRLPDLIYASISSFGQTGPMGARGGHDISLQGMAGLVRGDDPAPAPLPVADLASGMFAAVGVLASLLGRERRGGGSYVDVSMLDALVSWRSTALVSAMNGLDPAPYPPVDPGYGVFETSTGELITLSIAGEDHQWRTLCEVAGLEHLAALTTEERERSAPAIAEQLRTSLSKADWSVLEPVLSGKGVGWGPVYDDDQVGSDPQVEARNMIVEVPGTGQVKVVRLPILFDGQAGRVGARAPRLGQHTRTVLEEIGYAAGHVDELSAAGIVLIDDHGES